MTEVPKTSKIMPIPTIWPKSTEHYVSTIWSEPTYKPSISNTNINDPTMELYTALEGFTKYIVSQGLKDIPQNLSGVLLQIWKLLTKLLSNIIQSYSIIGVETTVSAYNNIDPNAVSWAHILEDTYTRNAKIVYKDKSLFNKDKLDAKIAKLNLDDKVVTELLYDDVDF